MISVVCYSGGKDSTALLLWARRSGIEPRRVIFADTGNEHPLTIEYVAEIERRTGETITRVRGPETFDHRVVRLRGFPTPKTKWCTQELKIEPTRRELDRIRDETGDDVQVIVGNRREESPKRERDPDREWADFYDCELWRPLNDWTLAQVIEEHHRAGVPLNPLYKLGADRVGCWPCINAGKAEIRLVAEMTPERIDQIRELERSTKNTMFAKEAPKAEWVEGEKRHELPLPIDEAVAWAKTSRGGKQLQLVRSPGGCERWGICEAASWLKEVER